MQTTSKAVNYFSCPDQQATATLVKVALCCTVQKNNFSKVMGIVTETISMFVAFLESHNLSIVSDKVLKTSAVTKVTRTYSARATLMEMFALAHLQLALVL